MLCVFYRLFAYVAVAGKAFQQDFELLRRAADSRKLRTEGGIFRSKRVAVFHGNIEVVAHRRESGARFFQLFPTGFHLPVELFAPLFQCTEFIGAGENAGSLRGTAACHGSARMYHLPVQSYDAITVIVVPGNADGIRQRFYHDGLS